MSQQRMALWATEAELDDDLEDVEPSLATGTFGPSEYYDDLGT
jgi:hypothetical protein